MVATAGSPRTSSRASTRTRSRLLAAVITGTYAWSLTVLPPLTIHGGTSPAAIFAGIALVSLLASPLLAPGRFALVAALDVFVGFCLLSWWAGRQSPVSPPFAVFGSFGWLAYTLALGALSTPRDPDDRVDPGPHLDPRRAPSRASAVAFFAVLLGCLVLLGAAWAIDRPATSVFAHVVALSAVLLLLRSGSHLAIFLQVRGTKLVTPLHFRAALLPLLCVLGLLIFGLGRLLMSR